MPNRLTGGNHDGMWQLVVAIVGTIVLLALLAFVGRWFAAQGWRAERGWLGSTGLLRRRRRPV
jgi:hypothetical protein